MIHIVVGDPEAVRDFYIHEVLLTTRSKFFERAMRKGWKEAEHKLVKLPEDDPETFALYEQIVYTSRIPLLDFTGSRASTSEVDGETVCNAKDKCDREYTYLSKLYVLAEKLQDVKTKNTAVEGIIVKVTHESQTVNNMYEGGPCLPSPSSIKFMYEGTPKHCAGRQVLLDCFVYYAQHGSSDLHDALLPRLFLVDLSCEALDHRPQQKIDQPDQVKGRYMECEEEGWSTSWSWENTETYPGK